MTRRSPVLDPDTYLAQVEAVVQEKGWGDPGRVLDSR